ncbi:MAG: HAD-IIA family hydrolase [Acidimicrobiia bacterium]
MSTIASDLDGVVYLGDEGIPGSGEALRRLVDDGYRVVFVTNNSSRSRHEVAARITALTGFPADPADVVGSGLATARFIAGRVSSALVVGGDGLRATLEGEGVAVVERADEAEAVVVGLDPDLTYARLVEATRALRNGAGFYATNTDATFPTPTGLWPGGGAIVAALVVASEREPVVCGKPHEPMRDLVRSMAGGDVLVVGDRPETDLAMGKEEGWPTALVLTGVVSDPAEVDPAYAPDLVVDSLADLPGVLREARAARPQ